jgi:hypothetical protein
MQFQPALSDAEFDRLYGKDQQNHSTMRLALSANIGLTIGSNVIYVLG